MIKFIPKETTITSTSVVKNEFEKIVIQDEEDQEPEEEIPEDEMTTI